MVVSAEEIVEPAAIRSDPNRTVFPGFIVDAVVEAPFAAHPSYAHGYYDRDNAFYQEWDRTRGTEEAVRAYLDEWVYAVPDRAAYAQRLPREVRARIPVRSHPSAPTPFNTYWKPNGWRAVGRAQLGRRRRHRVLRPSGSTAKPTTALR